jgi:RNA polymerase sigma-70 factor (ECF subfamily)
MKSDEDLMAAYVAGDQAAFEDLFRRYAPALLRVIGRQLSSPGEAHDLVQQTFLQLHRARYDFKPGARLRPWIFTIALNLKREHFRRLKRRPEAPLELDGRNDPAFLPDSPERAENQRAVRRALDQLPPDHREVIVLHWLEGLSFPEVSAIVGASVSAVKVRAHRGYVALRKLLAEAGNRPNPPGIPPEDDDGMR